MVFFERLVHVVHKEQPDSTICASGHCSSKSGQYEKCPVKGVTAILALGAINGVCVQPWQMHPWDVVSMIGECLDAL